MTLDERLLQIQSCLDTQNKIQKIIYDSVIQKFSDSKDNIIMGLSVIAEMKKTDLFPGLNTISDYNTFDIVKLRYGLDQEQGQGQIGFEPGYILALCCDVGVLSNGSIIELRENAFYRSNGIEHLHTLSDAELIAVSESLDEANAYMLYVLDYLDDTEDTINKKYQELSNGVSIDDITQIISDYVQKKDNDLVLNDSNDVESNEESNSEAIEDASADDDIKQNVDSIALNTIDDSKSLSDDCDDDDSLINLSDIDSQPDALSMLDDTPNIESKPESNDIPIVKRTAKNRIIPMRSTGKSIEITVSKDLIPDFKTNVFHQYHAVFIPSDDENNSLSFLISSYDCRLVSKDSDDIIIILHDASHYTVFDADKQQKIFTGSELADMF